MRDKINVRKLSIMHPSNQIKFVKFYDNYAPLILSLCSKSKFSIRYPAKVAKYSYSPDFVYDEDEFKDEDVETEPDILDRETKLLKSYFTYKEFDLSYKFFESYDFRILEQKYDFFHFFDIKKCFYNIYTHSICWAVKNKKVSKSNSRLLSFENTFDEIMQKTNYNETNGIIVGPEISRIFAEIILQKIDLEVFNILSGRNIEYGKDYEIRRYVDDYYVFSNDENTLLKIYKEFQNKLEYYKLYINSSKTTTKTSPFISNISVFKYEIKKIFKDVEKSIIVEEDNTVDGKSYSETLKFSQAPYSISNRIITEIQCATKRNDLTYKVTSRDVLRYLKKIIRRVLKNQKILKEERDFTNLSLFILDIAFYVYSLDVRVNTTYKLSQIIVLIYRHIKDKNSEIKHVIYSKVLKEADFIMSIHNSKKDDFKANIESSNCH